MINQFHPNQIFYVKDIGYARILIDKNAKQDQKINQNKVEVPPPIIKTVSQSKEEQTEQDQDVAFYPEMFNLEAQRSLSKNGHQVSAQLINIANERKVSMDHRQSRQAKKQVKIIGLKLQNTNIQVFAEQSLLLKKITLKIKSMLHNQRKYIQIQIDIIKTIDVLKTYIFDKIGEEIGYYYDIRMFATSPTLQQLSMGSRTIWQCGLKSNSKIIIAGKFNFTFKAPENKYQQFYALSNGNMTITGAKPVKKEEPTVVPIIQEQNKQAVNQNKQPKQVTNKQQISNNSSTAVLKVPQKQILKEEPLHLYCMGKFSTGMNYWQIKLQKIDQLKKQKALLFLGICLKDDNDKLQGYWGYDPIKLKKIQMLPAKKQMIKQKQEISEGQDQDQNSSDDEYGAAVKNGDTIGILLILRQNLASLVFYKNSYCLQQCHKLNMKKFESNQSISPFVMIRGQCSLTLDSKANEPLDVYRLK